jgi:hypothetical protein
MKKMKRRKRMHIELKEEHEDGSGTFSLDLNQKEIEQLVGYAVNELLRKLVDEMAKNGTLPFEQSGQ